VRAVRRRVPRVRRGRSIRGSDYHWRGRVSVLGGFWGSGMVFGF
jgi:hypothetical protein